MWCYLVIDSFDWKIVLFQQTVIGVYYILKDVQAAKMFALDCASKVADAYYAKLDKLKQKLKW